MRVLAASRSSRATASSPATRRTRPMRTAVSAQEKWLPPVVTYVSSAASRSRFSRAGTALDGRPRTMYAFQVLW